ncbi:MAG: thioredoxin [Bacteroidia bacterium]
MSTPPKTLESLISQSPVPVLVDFSAQWCGPCHAIKPIIKQLAQEHAQSLKVVIVDVDAQPHLAQRFRIQAVPTLILFHQGKPLWRQSGVLPLAQLKQNLKPYLSL